MTFYAVFPIVIGLFLAMVLCLEMGYRVGRRRIRHDGVAAHEGISSMEAATFALLGLLPGSRFLGPSGDSMLAAALSCRRPTPSARHTCGSTSRRRTISRSCAGCFVSISMPASGSMPHQRTMRRPIWKISGTKRTVKGNKEVATWVAESCRRHVA